MDDFKLKSLDDFDLGFLSDIKASETPAPAPVKVTKKPSLIPEIEKPFDEEPIEINFFDIPEDSAPEAPAAPIASAVPAAPADEILPEGISMNKPVYQEAPVTAPLYESSKMSDGVEPFVYTPPTDDDYEDDYEFDEDLAGKKKLGKGALAGKIISIILLVATVVVFILGCFVSAFLDNGSEIFSTTFSTLEADNEKVSIPKGALIIGKRIEANEYKAGDLVAIPSSNGEGCDIGYVTAATPTFDGTQLTLLDSNITKTYNSNDTYGIASQYIPSLGSLLTFAIKNAILVCVLFILLAALWCLVIVLVEKSGSKSADNDDDEDSDTEVIDTVPEVEEKPKKVKKEKKSKKAKEADDDDDDDGDYDEPVYKF